MIQSLFFKLAIAFAPLLLGRLAGGRGNVIRGSGKLTTEKRDVHGFNEVHLSGSGNLTITRTGTESLTIEAEDNIIPYLETEVSGHHLTIGTRDNVSLQTTRPINYILTVKDLDALSLSGSGNITASGVPDLAEIHLSGSGNMFISGIDGDKLTARISGSGDLNLAGKAGSQEVRISGSGNYRAEALESKAATLEVSGSGRAAINAAGNLDARISGSGYIEYAGDPTISQSITGSGRLRKR
jgi:hypothetical protein